MTTQGGESISCGSRRSAGRGVLKHSALRQTYDGESDDDGGDNDAELSPKMLQLKKVKTVSIAKLAAEGSEEEVVGGEGAETAESSGGGCKQAVSEETARKRQQLKSRTRSNLLLLRSRTVSIADLSQHDDLLREKLELAQDMLEATTPKPERQTELQQKWNLMAGSRVGQSQDGEEEHDEEEDRKKGPGLRDKLGNVVGKITVQKGLTRLLQAGSSFRAGLKDIQMEEEEMRQCFMSMDIDDTGLLDIHELQYAYEMAGVEISKANLRNIIVYCRKSMLKGKHQHSAAAAAAAADPDLITFADFQEMIKMRKFAAWNSNEVTSTADLPLSFGVVASGHRRKHILQSFLANDFLGPGDKLGARLQELQRQKDDDEAAAAGAGVGDAFFVEESRIFNAREAEELHERVASRLPPKLQAKLRDEEAATGRDSESFVSPERRTAKVVEPWLSASQSTSGRKTSQRRSDGVATLRKRRVNAHPTGRFLGSAVPAVAPLMPGLPQASGRSHHIRRRRPALSSGRVGSSTPPGLASAASSQQRFGAGSRSGEVPRLSLPSIALISHHHQPSFAALYTEPSLAGSEVSPTAKHRRSAPAQVPPSTGMRIEPSVGVGGEMFPGAYHSRRSRATTGSPQINSSTGNFVFDFVSGNAESPRAVEYGRRAARSAVPW